MIFKIPQYQAHEYWPSMRDYLDAALKKFDTDKKYPLDYVLRDLIAGTAQGWLIVQNDKPVSATVTEIQEYPLGKAVNIFLMGGDSMQDWGDELHEAIVKYAREIGAKWIETGSRRGIGKLFYDRLGYTRRYESYTYEVGA